MAVTSRLFVVAHRCVAGAPRPVLPALGPDSAQSFLSLPLLRATLPPLPGLAGRPRGAPSCSSCASVKALGVHCRPRRPAWSWRGPAPVFPLARLAPRPSSFQPHCTGSALAVSVAGSRLLCGHVRSHAHSSRDARPGEWEKRGGGPGRSFLLCVNHPLCSVPPGTAVTWAAGSVMVRVPGPSAPSGHHRVPRAGEEEEEDLPGSPHGVPWARLQAAWLQGFDRPGQTCLPKSLQPVPVCRWPSAQIMGTAPRGRASCPSAFPLLWAHGQQEFRLPLLHTRPTWW